MNINLILKFYRYLYYKMYKIGKKDPENFIIPKIFGGIIIGFITFCNFSFTLVFLSKYFNLNLFPEIIHSKLAIIIIPSLWMTFIQYYFLKKNKYKLILKEFSKTKDRFERVCDYLIWVYIFISISPIIYIFIKVNIEN